MADICLKCARENIRLIEVGDVMVEIKNCSNCNNDASLGADE